MGVKALREILQAAALRWASLRDPESEFDLDVAAEQFGVAKRRARVRREKWRERQGNKENAVGDGIKVCRVNGCRSEACYRPVILFAPDDEGDDPVRVETALLDVCEAHARNLGPEAYTENPAIWGAIVKVWTDNGMEAPDPDSAISVAYEPIQRVNGAARHA